MSGVNTQTQVTVIVNQQTTVVNQPQAPVQQQTAVKTTLNTQDTFQAETKKSPTSPTGIVKLIGGGALVGGGISAVATTIGKAMINETLQAPGIVGIGVGASLGAGIGLLNVESDNKTVKSAANTAGGALLGLGIAGVAQSIGKAIMTEYVHNPSTSGVLLGASLGGGIALANADLGDKQLNNIKKTVAGALIGGGTVGLASALVKTIANDRLMCYSPVAMGVGMAIGAGIGLLNMDD